MEPLKAICETCGGQGARRQLRAYVSMREPLVMRDAPTVETCDTCGGRGGYPMPGRPIVGSLRGLLDGPEPGLA